MAQEIGPKVHPEQNQDHERDEEPKEADLDNGHVELGQELDPGKGVAGRFGRFGIHG